MSKRLIMKLAILGVAVVAATWLVTSPVYIRPSDLPPGMAEAAPQRCIGVFIICMPMDAGDILISDFLLLEFATKSIGRHRREEPNVHVSVVLEHDG